jgi:hypothetical protein
MHNRKDSKYDGNDITCLDLLYKKGPIFIEALNSILDVGDVDSSA